ncbi:KH domain-containing protein, partial [Vibrio parahaemolyticus]|nr:KH domain-containing protein [Vibrio parahaemolyticus]
ESNKPSSFFLRLLILTAQVGCVLGKGGSVIKRMAAESGAQIRGCNSFFFFCCSVFVFVFSLT